MPATVVEQLLLQESSQAWRWMRPPGVQVVPGLEDEYAAFPSLCELMPFRSPGVKTSRDAVAFAFTREELESQVRAAGWGWDPGRAIRSLYRPGDVRWLYYDPARLGRPRPDLARHVLPDELSLIATRQYVGDEFSHVAVCRGLACHGVFYLGNRGQDYLFPRTLNGQSGRRPNLEPGRLPESLQDPGRLMAYVAAVLLDPAYRTRYRELLPHDFPRIPISPDPAIVERMCRWGTKWIGWQLWQQGMAPPPGEVSEGVALRSTAFEEPARVGRRGFPRFDEGRVMLAEETWLGPVNNDTWNTRIGGYRVCETFWKSRRGRAVFEEDLESFRRLIQVLVRTRELQRRIAACGRTPLDSPSPPG